MVISRVLRSDVFTMNKFENKTIFNFNDGNEILIKYGWYAF